MNLLKYILLLGALLICVLGFAQQEPSVKSDRHAPVVRQLTLEPGIGFHTNFGVDLLISNLAQWNPCKHLGVASYTSFNINNITQRYFNYIKTNYNYSINQKFGAGTSFFPKEVPIPSC